MKQVTINDVFKGLPDIVIGVLTFLTFWMVASFHPYMTGISEGERLILLVLTAYGFVFSLTKCVQGIVDILTYFGQMITKWLVAKYPSL